MRKAGDIVTALFNERYGPDFVETARSSAGLFSSWTKIAAKLWPGGEDRKDNDIPAAAAHSKISELEKGILVVEADHPGWIQILQTKQEEMLSMVQRRYPELKITGIAFKLSRDMFSEQKPVIDESSENKSIPEVKENIKYKNWETARDDSKPKDEEFMEALKNLEKSMKKRNRL